MGQSTSTNNDGDFYKNMDNCTTETTKIKKDAQSIYVLELADGKYYVGKSQDPNIRINEHIQNNGSSWTQKHKPIRTLNIYEMKDEFDEDKYTLKLMKEKGIMNVRGGSFCNIILSDGDVDTIIKMINSSEDGCYYCGSTYHFI